MLNTAFVVRQLQQALSHIRTVLDATALEPAAEGGSSPELLAPAPPFNADIGRSPPTREDLRKALAADGQAELHERPDPLARSMAMAMTIQKQVDQGRVIVALTERLDNLTRILLDIAPDACAKHDLFGF
jgi:hypothetical protein